MESGISSTSKFIYTLLPGKYQKEAEITPTSFKLMWQSCQFGHFNMIKVLKIITIITSNFQDFKIWNTISWVLGFFKWIKINISDPHWDAKPAYNSWSLPAHSMETTITSIILKFEFFFLFIMCEASSILTLLCFFPLLLCRCTHFQRQTHFLSFL